jgi:HYR domain
LRLGAPRGAEPPLCDLRRNNAPSQKRRNPSGQDRLAPGRRCSVGRVSLRIHSLPRALPQGQPVLANCILSRGPVSKSGDLFPLGTTTVTCTATDSSGNSRSCSFLVTVRTNLDFGDAPDRNYQTKLASDGARHQIVPGWFLGSTVDRDDDGHPSAEALLDDSTDQDDEDGVFFPDPLVEGRPTSFGPVLATAPDFSTRLSCRATTRAPTKYPSTEPSSAVPAVTVMSRECPVRASCRLTLPRPRI